MMTCPYCGSGIPNNSLTCEYCGTLLRSPTKNDAPVWPFLLLGFFFPYVGFILFLVKKNQNIKQAKAALKGAIVSVVLCAILSIAGAIFYYNFLLPYLVGI